MAVKPLTLSEQKQFLQFRTGDRILNGRIIHVRSFSDRLYFFLLDLFSDTKNPLKTYFEFVDFHERIKLNIDDLTHKVRKGADLDKTIPAIVTLLKIHARVMNSHFGDLIRVFEFKHEIKVFQEYHAEIVELQSAAKEKVNAWTAKDYTGRKETSRWVYSTLSQQRFAAYKNMDQLPYRFEEIPTGAIILTNPNSFFIGSVRLKNPVKGETTSEKITKLCRKLFRRFKGLMCQIATGKVHNHAELCLGNGASFDLSKDDGRLIPLYGKMKLSERKGRTCYADIIVPDQQKMFLAHKARFPTSIYESFTELWAAIDKEARASTPLLSAGPREIVSVAFFPRRRPTDYDATQAWQPGKKNYGCSANISALFSKFGIDLGAQFGKMDQNVSPANLLDSKFFKPLYSVD